MKPFFSIVIPTLNEEKFLPKLLESLRAQNFKKFEIVVVDALSKDKTVKAAENWQEIFKKRGQNLIIVNAKKRNVSFQRNLGARQAQGDYLVFFDADVIVEAKFLKKVFGHIKKEESLLMTTWLVSDSEEITDELLILLTNYGLELARYTKKPFLPGFNIIVERNSFWAIGGFNEKIKHAEDIYFAQKARRKGIMIRFLKEPILTMSLRRFRSEGRVKVLKKYAQSLTHILFKGPITNDIFDYPMGGEYHLNHKKEDGWQELKKKWNRFFHL